VVLIMPVFLGTTPCAMEQRYESPVFIVGIVQEDREETTTKVWALLGGQTVVELDVKRNGGLRMRIGWSVHPHGKTRLLLHGFSKYFIFPYFSKIRREK